MLLLLLPSAVSAFFFPQTGGGCQCSCAPAPPPICPPLPTCAIPAPCPDYSSSNWQVAAVPAIPGIPAQPYPVHTAVEAVPAPSIALQPAVTYAEATPSGCGGGNPLPPTVLGCSGVPAPAPAPAALPVSLPVSLPAPASGFASPSSSYSYQSSSYQSSYPAPQLPVAQPSEDFQEDKIVEVVAQPTFSPTLIPPVEPVASNYDDTAPALPPPPPAPAVTVPEYKTSETIIPSTEYQSGYVPRAETQYYDQESGLHSGETSSFPPLGRKVSTEGIMEPLNAFQRRNLILKRMRNVRTMGAVIPHTNATCNSNKLANIMARAIVPDVSVAKRMVMRSAELAFDGAKFDVFCATGEFSYSIHSRKYCEVTRDDVTCFAFR